MRDLRAADHLLHGWRPNSPFPRAAFGCTHLVRGDRPRVALSFTLPSEPLLRTARERLTAGEYEVTPGTPDAVGRAVLYPGVSSLTGTLTVAHLLDAPRSTACPYSAPGTNRPRTHRW